MKKLLALFVALMLVFSTVPAFMLTANAEEVTGECGDSLTWSYDTDTGALVITGTGAMTDYTKASAIPWYSYKASIASVSLPAGITNIGAYAFYNCKPFSTLIIPDSVTTIGKMAFFGCTGIATLTIGSDVTTINSKAFYNCSALATVYNYSELSLTAGSTDYGNVANYAENVYKLPCEVHTGGEATCTTKAVCTICLLEYGEKDENNHKNTSTINASTENCGVAGYTGDTYCSDCETTVATGSEILATGNHTGGEATCTKKAVCTVCSQEYGEKDANNHKNTSTINASTENCGVAGYTGDTYCSDCETTVATGSEIPATGNHTGGEATCTKKAVCTVCSQEYGEKVANNHKNTSTINASTENCGVAGYTGDTYCSDCETTVATGSEIPATGNHTGGTATCTKKAVCTVCSQEYGEKLEHTPIESGNYDSTCTATGWESKTVCDVCEEVLTEGNVVDVKAHTEEVIEAKAATCTSTGLTAGKKCSVCGTVTVAQKEVAKKAHTYKTTTTKATLSTNGSKVTKCTVCGYKKSSSIIYKISSVKLAATTYSYTGKAISPAVTVKNSKGTKLVKGTNYTVSYATGRKNVGKYKVTVTFKGNYSGSKTLYFTINPAKTTVKKLTPAKKALKVSITKKSAQVSGYQIQYSTAKSFSGAKSVKITGTSKTIKSLKAKKTYYVRVRTYKKVGSTIYYSAWSAAKKAKTK